MKTIFLIFTALCLRSFFYTRAETQTQTLTPHFSAWLKENGYGSFGFERTDINGGSFGGKKSDHDQITREPVIFFHGNGDRATGNFDDELNGFADSIAYFLSQGYKESELYVTTWGPAKVELAALQYHSEAYLKYLRSFTEAVLKYTGAEKIDIIGHSMGVTLARKVIHGGTGIDGDSEYNLGPSLASNVDTFLGIAGANLGLTTCQHVPQLPTCGKVNGFYPGTGPGPVELSVFLNDLLNSKEIEGDYVFSMLSTADELIGNQGMVWGKLTSKIPLEDGSKIYNDLSHMGLKTKTPEEQLKIISTHTT